MPPSYPYPPSPYPTAKWSQSQDQGYKTNYQLPPTRPLVNLTYTGHTSTDNILSEILPQRTSFQAWVSFEGRVQQAKQDIHAHCAGLSSEQLGSLMLPFVFAHEQLTTNRNIISEADVSGLVYSAYSSVAKLHQHPDDASTILKKTHRARLPSALFRFGGSPELDFVFLREDLAPNQIQARHRLVAVEVKKANFPLTASALARNNPTRLAQSHNGNYKPDKPAWYVRMMSQALTYAMHTKCGCVIVTNHNQAMFMQVAPYRDSAGAWKLDMKVSKLYRCNETRSSFHSALAILRKSSEAEDISSNLGGAFRQLQGARMSRSTRSRSTSLRIQGSQTPAGPSTRSQTRQTGSTRRNRARAHHDTAPPPQQDDPETDTVLDRFYQPQLIRHLMERSDDIIAHEGHSTVLRSRYKEIDVAVKYWNCDTSKGLEMLSNELKVYEEVVSKHAHLLGAVLPRLIALWNEPKTDTVIVLEYVGEALTRPDYGSAQRVLLVGGKELDNNDYRLLQQAAFDALEKMHSTGLRHRDLDERNIRAKREVGENGEVTWKVWFIDLGLASFSGDSIDAAGDENSLWAATCGPPNDVE